MNFDKDLNTGEEEEKYILNILQELDISSFMSEGNFSDWDINMPIKRKTIEIKSDEASDTTGNLAFEIYFKGKPSGLNKTKADLWISTDSNYLYIFKTKELIKFLKDNKEFVQEKNGGDNNWSKILLIKKDNLMDICCLIRKGDIDFIKLKEFI